MTKTLFSITRLRLPLLIAGVVFLTGAIALVGSSPGPTPQESPGVLVSLHRMTLKTGADAEAFEKFFGERVRPYWQEYYPGCTASLLRGERQAEPGTYIEMIRCDSKAVRDRYWPEPDTPSPAARAEQERAGAVANEINAAFETFTDYVGFVDYIVVG